MAIVTSGEYEHEESNLSSADFRREHKFVMGLLSHGDLAIGSTFDFQAFGHRRCTTWRQVNTILSRDMILKEHLKTEKELPSETQTETPAAMSGK